MKAAWYEKTGDAADVLKVGELPDPSPGSNEVLISVKTSGVNPSDVKTRAGARGDLQFSRIVPHSDGAGIIVDVGKNVDSNRIGERVWIWNAAYGRPNGTCAELISLPENQAVAMSDHVSFEAAACLGIPASTAYYGIFAEGSVQNKTLMITGGAGAVGFYGIQLAKWAGAKVISTVSSKEKFKIAEDAGADLILNYKKDNVVDSVLEFTKGDGVDHVLEVEFGGNIQINPKIINTNGTIAAYASMGNIEPTLPFYDFMFKGIKINTFLIYSICQKDRKILIEGMTKALNENALKHLIGSSFSLDDIVDAHEEVESNKNVGNVIVTV